jgi:hypothetical protein
MQRLRRDDRVDPVLRLIEPGEDLRVTAIATDSVLAVTDKRIVVARGERLAFDVPIEGVRRIQFDVERRRPATLVLVPENPVHGAQVLSIPAGEIGLAAEAVRLVGERLARIE